MDEDSMVMDSFESNLNPNDTGCKYYIVKAISLDKLMEMQNMGIFEPLNSNIRNKIIETAQINRVTIIVTVTGSRNFQGYAHINREELLNVISSISKDVKILIFMFLLNINNSK